MSQPSRPQAQGPAQRRRRQIKFEAVQPLEDRCLLAPLVAISPIIAGSAPAGGTVPANTSSTNVTVTLGTADTGFLTAAPFTSVAELTPISSFGGDIVRIRSGPGGPFGNDVYAISRGAGENSANLTAAQIANNNTTAPVVSGAINRPGVIYRVDPATGKTNVFFDLNTLIPQLEPADNKGATAANSAGAEDRPGQLVRHHLRPRRLLRRQASMFVSSVDRQDPTKNAIYRIAPDGTLHGHVRRLQRRVRRQQPQRQPQRHPRPPGPGPDLPPGPDRRRRNQQHRHRAVRRGPLLQRQRLLPGQGHLGHPDADQGRDHDPPDRRPDHRLDGREPRLHVARSTAPSPTSAPRPAPSPASPASQASAGSKGSTAIP